MAMRCGVVCGSSAAILAAALLGLEAPFAHAQATDSAKTPGYGSIAMPDTSVVRSFGGFVDTYYAWDFDRPHFFDRAYTTQPARHAEANVNLAYIETRIAGPRYRGRLALQWGTSVQANYAGEPKIGSISGPGVSQFIQEATAGYQATKALWIDAGIFPSHLGYESWISRDNLSYTRSFVAEFSPYYEAGVKATWTASSKLTATFAVVNGWQDISVYNTPPAGGIRLDYSPDSTVTISYDNFIGDAAPDSEPTRARFYHDVIVQYNPKGHWQFAAVYAIGTQGRTTLSNGTASWWGVTSFVKYHINSTVAVVGRGERYSDPSQVIVVTGLPSAFQTTGASLGIDVNPAGPLLWRTELRGSRSGGPVWPLYSLGHFGPNDSFLVSSLAITF
jgi:Putative beta-barrel porin-2, OmpL-like. bbp2